MPRASFNASLRWSVCSYTQVYLCMNRRRSEISPDLSMTNIIAMVLVWKQEKEDLYARAISHACGCCRHCHDL